ncbi:bifunctional diaminohydroxyphosphoribosylaminopyrimidine deaminase/5-amino-6-(5-phosphoribosylamino)uracil reductase RibD [Jiulongibacter sediminis]|uniref:Riboflavin biosynthesis protein RibD n=1 Tax=Jiulongibacter sediminis TaxID=1605367 RepID=A0A0P7C646_9BACT|nr:bifunctional diaminohydroxyphosphoribosylaminopyrimidine deaminase/5-amino-6-(5-phosphoribosylamino)uracil reductase RibD [Jiulongibacter sediminis]KPM48830.1 riboflavin biosynthesis protein RibD [Jiulongibacter sediminis]TBX25361.1 riboflavin biosynthesis protein RibD [Jiulongibacter sediminis]
MNDLLYMQRALELAALGKGSVSPNPMVGCVIVYNDQIIGEGWHKKYGGPHAEVNAIQDVKNKDLLSESTAYVTLEPCSHFGKTPPCADLLISHRIKKVVICNTDPFPQVNGKGIQKLKDAGIEVITGVLEKKGLELNKRFFTSIEQNRPYVILKWAESADGFVANPDGSPFPISGQISQMHSHKWRTEEDAIMVGSNTVFKDNPSLTARKWTGKNPVRVIIEGHSSIPDNSHIFDLSVKTFVFTFKVRPDKENLTFIKIEDGTNLIDFVLTELHKLNIRSLIVEGGPRLHQLFFENGNYDEERVFKSKALMLKHGIQAAVLPKHLVLKNQYDLREDILNIFSA